MTDSATSEPMESGFLSPSLLLAAIVDSSDDAIISKNLDGIITSWNKGAERIFGYQPEEMIGQPILRLLPEARKEEEAQILARLRRGERVEHFETIRVRKDGRQLNMSLTISPVRNREGKIIGASKIARDVTEQKKALLALAQANEALRRADRLKAEFISTLSHELRTPLTAIYGWIHILKEATEPAEIAQGLAVIERNVRAQGQLIEDLLDISRIEAGKMNLDVQRLDLASVVSAAIETVKPAAEAKGISLSADFSGAGANIMGDRQRLQQIVWNLLMNAVKFTPKGGGVRCLVNRVDSHALISVSDTGIGIPSEFIDRIFDRFSQADGSTTRRHGGLGLGLAIVKHLTELHGGTISANSGGTGCGATFTVRLPVATARCAPKSCTEGGASVADGGVAAVDGGLQGIRVLAVDDDADSIEILRLILERNGASVTTSRSMESALAAFAECKPDVLLSDIGMPGHDGYELISSIRALPEGRTVPAVALTALARNEDRSRSLKAGFQMHIAKPVEAGELVAVVRNLASLHQPAA